MIKRIILLLLLVLPPCLTAQSQNYVGHRQNCTPNVDIMPLRSPGMMARRTMSEPIQTWDSTRVYRQIVILMEFSDSTFVCSDPNEYYNRLFNEKGYNEGVGPGCVADYFRDQSGGLFKPVFDVFGPYKIDLPAKRQKNLNLGDAELKQVIELFLSDNANLDYTPYDWNGDGCIEQVICVYASYAGNDEPGFIWPSSGYIGKTFSTPDNLDIFFISYSSELWPERKPCGIGIICHEYCHCFGLPDIYPNSSSGAFSVFDEWDLMDGGNYSNWGWCPPNLSTQEKMYLGWSTPIELNSSTVITGMKSISDGGPSYIIYHTGSEFLTLENRQRTGWDTCIPGQGLLISRIDFDQNSWCYNNVNTAANPDDFRYKIIPADNLSYDDWETLLPRIDGDNSCYEVPDEKRNNRRLSTSAYPWHDTSTGSVNDKLTDTSVPAAQMASWNKDHSKLLGKSITNISMAPDGTISFDFMDPPSAVRYITDETGHDTWYNIDGRRLPTKPIVPGQYILNGHKVITR